MIKPLLSLTAALTIAAPAIAQEEATEAHPSPGQIVEAASAQEWVAIPADDLLVMTLAPDDEGNSREIVIQLMPAPFSQGWVHNVKLLSRSEYYDGLAVIRVQDNYVTQWGDPADEEDAKPLPDGLKVMKESAYEISSRELSVNRALARSIDRYETSQSELKPGQDMPQFIDTYGVMPFFVAGWPIGLVFEDDFGKSVTPVHCYGMIGVARGLSPSTGDGSSLYTVIGHAPRHLDRNIALVGRVIDGMEHLSSLPRGKGALGFYEEVEAHKRTAIQSVRVVSDLPEEDRPSFEYLSTEGESFAKYAEARANRRDPFFIQSAGGADICNIPVPIRRVEPE